MKRSSSPLSDISAQSPTWLLLVATLLIGVGMIAGLSGITSADEHAEVVSIEHDGPTETDGELEITVETNNSVGTIVRVDDENQTFNVVDITSTGDDVVRIEDGKIEFLDINAGESTYTVTADIEGGDSTDTGSISAWVNAEDPADADDEDRTQFTIETSADPPTSGNGPGSGSGTDSGRDDFDDSTTTDNDRSTDTTGNEGVTVENVVETVDNAEPTTATEIKIAGNGDTNDEGVTVDTTEETDSVKELLFEGENVESVSVEEFTENNEVFETTAVSIEQAIRNDPTEDTEEDATGEPNDGGIVGDNAVDTTEETDSTDDISVNVVTVAQISVEASDEEETPATVMMSADPATIDNPERTRIYHETDDGWEELPTQVTEETNEEVVFIGETDGFSLFAIAEIEPEGGESTESVVESGETGDETPGFGVSVVVGALVSGVLLATRQRRCH